MILTMLAGYPPVVCTYLLAYVCISLVRMCMYVVLLMALWADTYVCTYNFNEPNMYIFGNVWFETV